MSHPGSDSFGPSALNSLSMGGSDTAPGPGPVQRLLNLHDGQSSIPDVVKLGDRVVPELEGLLRSPSQSLPHSRCWAADSLAAIGSDAAFHALLRALRDCSSRVPAAATQNAEDIVVSTIAEHLGSSAGSEVAAVLLEALSRRPYLGCIRALGRIRQPQAIPRLVECLGEDVARRHAVDALARFGPQALADLEKYIRGRVVVHGEEPPSRIDGRIAAINLVGDLLHGSGDLLDNTVRRTAERTLNHATHDPESGVRVAAALSLCGSQAPPDWNIAGVLVDALSTDDWQEATVIVRAISRLGLIAERPLLCALASRNETAGATRRRLRAIPLAGRLGTSAAAAAIGSLANSTDITARISAVRALESMPHGTTSILFRFLADPNAVVRLLALDCLQRRDAVGVEQAIRLLADPDREMQRHAAAILMQARGKSRRFPDATGRQAPTLSAWKRLLIRVRMWRCTRL